MSLFREELGEAGPGALSRSTGTPRLLVVSCRSGREHESFLARNRHEPLEHDDRQSGLGLHAMVGHNQGKPSRTTRRVGRSMVVDEGALLSFNESVPSEGGAVAHACQAPSTSCALP